MYIIIYILYTKVNGFWRFIEQNLSFVQVKRTLCDILLR